MFAAVRGCTRPSHSPWPLLASSCRLSAALRVENSVDSSLVRFWSTHALRLPENLLHLPRWETVTTHTHPHNPRTLTRTFVFMNAQFCRDSRATVRQCAVSGKVIRFAELTCVEMLGALIYRNSLAYCQLALFIIN